MPGVKHVQREEESKRGCTSIRPLNNNQSISYLCPASEREREREREREGEGGERERESKGA